MTTSSKLMRVQMKTAENSGQDAALCAMAMKHAPSRTCCCSALAAIIAPQRVASLPGARRGVDKIQECPEQ